MEAVYNYYKKILKTKYFVVLAKIDAGFFLLASKVLLGKSFFSKAVKDKSIFAP